MGFPSLGQLCRRQAIANINQVTYIPESLPLDAVMDIMGAVPSAGVLKSILSNSPHLLEDPKTIDELWERFVRKEFPYLLKEKLAKHNRNIGEHVPFPGIPWGDVYDALAKEHFERLQRNIAQAAATYNKINKEREQNKTTLLADPRSIMMAKPRGQPGSSVRPRAPTSALQRINHEVRQQTMQRKHAITAATAAASKPPVKTSTAPKGATYPPPSSHQTIRKPEVSSSNKTAAARELLRTKELHRLRGEKRLLEIKNRSSQATVSTTFDDSDHTSPVNAAKSPTTPAISMISTSAPATATAAQKPSETPAPRKGLFMSVEGRNFAPITSQKRDVHRDGCVTITTWINWNEFQNKRILATYSPAKQAALLAEKPVSTTMGPRAKYYYDALAEKTAIFATVDASAKKRGADAISTDAAATSATTAAAAPNSVKDAASPPPAAKKPRPAVGVFMPPRRRK